MDAREIEVLSLLSPCRIQAELMCTVLKVQADAMRQVSEIRHQRLRSKKFAAEFEFQKSLASART